MEREWLQVLIEANLKRALKAKAAQEGENMTSAIERLIVAWVNGEVKLEKPLEVA